ncbi:gluconate kinase [Fadolivirus algeromassiliense]|jgi:shikimate kinase|uniref:Gluconate kinase n=1 Tax=Fadolivirus FV1/VV64 TaxID=3070911 RepID=A0A7D3UPP5_9VIRU|nr:gluconate kinase [Fadolivirus algeromassiliense]QKF94088.1 gluconate kinase [Fadolivirus FV1/VV64]
MSNLIIAISGISGAGKTTIGKMLATKLGGVYLDQDWFFSKNKPLVTLSNGKKALNYDCDEAIDFGRFNRMIDNEKKNNKIIVIGGFALREYFFYKGNEPTIHFHIKIPRDLSLKTRLQVKKFSEERKKDEIYMFNEYVYPYYEKTLKFSKIDHMIDGVENGKRRHINEILEEILNRIKHIM